MNSEIKLTLQNTVAHESGCTKLKFMKFCVSHVVIVLSKKIYIASTNRLYDSRAGERFQSLDKNQCALCNEYFIVESTPMIQYIFTSAILHLMNTRTYE